MAETEKQVNLKLPAAVHKQLKLVCVQQGISIQEYLSRLVRASVADYGAKQPSGDDRHASISGHLESLNLAPIFSAVPRDHLKTLEDSTVHLHLNKGELILREGEIPPALYIIRQGKAHIFRISPSGKEYIIDTCKRGDPIALLATIASMPSFASVRAVEDTAISSVGRDAFLAFLGQNAGVVRKVLETEAEKLLSVYNKLINFSSGNTSQRLVNILTELSSKEGNNLSYTHQEIANMIGSTIETTTRVLAGLKRSGALRIARGTITIIDKERLQHPTYGGS